MGKILYKSEEQVARIKESCLIVCGALQKVAAIIEPGITGKELDAEAESFIRSKGAEPGFKGYQGFPATLCISINEGVVHGIPTGEPLRDGDIVSIDCGAMLNQFYGDSAYTFAIGNVSEELMDLLRTTNESLYKGIEQARVGNRLGDIGYAIQHYVERENSYSIVRELVGHGIGKNLHEPPEVPNYGKRGRGQKIQEGLVIAIEPMVNLGKRGVKQKPDGWTIITRDKKPSAHYEHTIVVREEGPEILTDHQMIEEAIDNNDAVKKPGVNKQIFTAAVKASS